MSDATSGGVVYRGRSTVELDDMESDIWVWLANLIGVDGYNESAPTDSPSPSVCLVEGDAAVVESALRGGGGGNGVVPYSSCDVLILSRSGAKRGCR
jgi:hypothetical protein